MDETPKIAVILNPRSGNGRTARTWRRLEPAVRSALGDFTLFLTQRPGHATELTRRALRDGYRRIVSAGGDGTHHEIVNGFFERLVPINPQATLALFPLGTGSDLRRTLNIPSGARAIRHLTSDTVMRVDVGRVRLTGLNGEPSVIHFINALHIGLGGLVAKRVNQGSKWMGGFLSFLKSVVISRLTYSNLPMTVRINGLAYSNCYLEIIVANGQYDGGGMHIAPYARLDSGFFDVYTLGDVGLIDTALNIPRIYKGTLEEHSEVLYFQATTIEVETDERVLVSPDGELAGVAPLSVEVLPAAIRMVTGPAVPVRTPSFAHEEEEPAVL
jgi:YegS/Rv2252/BmrU family lipid kinase